MKLLIICAVLSVCVAVSLSSPVRDENDSAASAETRDLSSPVRDENDSAASAETRELKITENDSSSSEEELNEQKIKVKDNSSGTSDTSEEQPEHNEIVEDGLNENTSVEHQELADDFIIARTKRAVVYAPHISNQLSVQDERSTKNEKYFKLRLIDGRNKRSADTSEENSSEEDLQDKSQAKGVVIAKKPETAPAETLQLAAKIGAGPAESLATLLDIRRKRNSPSLGSSEENSSEEEKQEAPAKGIVLAKKPETAPAETLDLAAKPAAATAASNPKSEVLRRRRSVEDFSTEDQSQQAPDENEVFILSKEKQTEVEDNNEDFDSNEQVLLSDKTFGSAESSSENNNSEEDYAQGCGGNRDNSNENSNENINF